MATDRIIEAKDNYCHIPMIDGDCFEILVNKNKVVEFIAPYNGTLKIYLAGEKKIAMFMTDIKTEKIK